MTATIAAADVDSVVKRADASYAKRFGDDPALPEYVKAIADAVRPLVGSAPAPAKVNDTQVKQLLADKQRLDDLVTELRKHVETNGTVIERQVRDLTALKKQLKEAEADAQRRITAAVGAVETVTHTLRDEVEKVRTALTLRTKELDEARAERDIATAQLREQGSAPTGALAQAQADNARLADDLAAVQEQLSTTRRDLTYANNLLDEIADAEAEQPVHVHRYVLDGHGAPKPCECGRRHPHDPAAYEDAEEVTSEAEPLAALLNRIGAELTEAGWQW